MQFILDLKALIACLNQIWLEGTFIFFTGSTYIKILYEKYL